MKFTFFTFLALFICTGFSAQVTMRNNFPSVIKGGTYFETEIKIDKMGIVNFAKYQMDVPAGVTVAEMDSRTGNFTFENNRAKIVWVSIPTEAELVLKFKISIPASLASPAYITQKFFYLDNGSKKEVDAEAITFTVSEGAVVASNTPKKDEGMSLHNNSKKNKSKIDTVTGIYKAEPKKEEPAKKQEVVKNDPPKKEEPVKKQEVVKNDPPAKKEEPVKKQEVVKNDPPVKKEEPVKQEVKKSEPIAGTIYRIQLAAGATDPGKAKYAAAGEVETLKEGGMYKVLTGNCATKEEALKLREALIAKGLTGFVVAYSNGVRVK